MIIILEIIVNKVTKIKKLAYQKSTTRNSMRKTIKHHIFKLSGLKKKLQNLKILNETTVQYGAHTCKPSTQQAETGRLSVQDQPELPINKI